MKRILATRKATISFRHRIYIHNFLLGCKGVDHINNDPLDNRRSNLRKCTVKQNMANQIKRSNCISKYKGVSLARTEKRQKKWRASCEYNNKMIYLGRYRTEIEAARAYNKKAYELWGEFAKLNEVKDG